jgi:hypothetical protein
VPGNLTGSLDPPKQSPQPPCVIGCPGQHRPVHDPALACPSSELNRPHSPPEFVTVRSSAPTDAQTLQTPPRARNWGIDRFDAYTLESTRASAREDRPGSTTHLASLSSLFSRCTGLFRIVLTQLSFFHLHLCFIHLFFSNRHSSCLPKQRRSDLAMVAPPADEHPRTPLILLRQQHTSGIPPPQRLNRHILLARPLPSARRSTNIPRPPPNANRQRPTTSL